MASQGAVGWSTARRISRNSIRPGVTGRKATLPEATRYKCSLGIEIKAAGSIFQARPILDNLSYPCAVGRTIISFTSTSAGCSIANAIARAIASGDLPRILEIFREASNSVRPFEVEVHIRRFEGEFRWFLSRARGANMNIC